MDGVSAKEVTAFDAESSISSRNSEKAYETKQFGAFCVFCL